MLISEGFEYFLGAQRRRENQRLLHQLIEREIVICIISNQKLFDGNNTHKIVEFSIACQNLAVPAFQQIGYNLFFFLQDIHPLHIGAMRHQMTGSLVGKIENLFVNDIFFPFDHTFFGSSLKHGSQLHFRQSVAYGFQSD
ncbi:MAG: hypothetical protein BWZ06_01579 [Bacteroidetes bacterium ADurb.BinA261]|nr:MAG: hypothetical protein BWZ06_01579 [Bacteroidetes bacterium ADurb.BinA261]